jgi:hypothetical protein
MVEQLTRIPFADRRGSTRYVQLPDARVGLRVRYLSTVDRWALWLLALDGSMLFGPVLVAPGHDLLHGRRHDSRVPQGQLFAYSPDGEAATLASADTDCVLFYRAP